MKISKCEFNPDNVAFHVTENGTIFIANTDTNLVYKVSAVKQVKVKMELVDDIEVSNEQDNK